MAFGADQIVEIENRMFEKNGGYRSLNLPKSRTDLGALTDSRGVPSFGLNEVQKLYDTEMGGNIDDLYKNVR